jgi:uncharacterized protein (TIGR02001 family)
MTFNISKTAGLGAVSALATVLAVGTAVADGVSRRGSIKDAPAPAPRACSLSANVGLTTDYVFRGFSQSSEGPAIQGGFDATCGLLYAGVWASSLDFNGATDPNVGGAVDARVEIDFYAGIKPKTGPVTWDLGVIYYSYHNTIEQASELNYVELKVGGSGEIWKDGTLGVTVFYSPDYQLETGPVWTVETSFAQVLPKVGMFTPTFSALVGYQQGDDAGYRVGFGNGDDNYVYWNVGLTLGFLEKWSLDLRYWDTNIDNNGLANGFCKGAVLQCDERFVATLKFTY